MYCKSLWIKASAKCINVNVELCDLQVQFLYLLSEALEGVGQGDDDASQLLVVQAVCQMYTCVIVLLFLSLPLQVSGCFGLKDVHHSDLPGFQVVLVSW